MKYHSAHVHQQGTYWDRQWDTVSMVTQTEESFGTSPQVAGRCTFLLLCPSLWLAPECQHLLWESSCLPKSHFFYCCPHFRSTQKHCGAAIHFRVYRHHATTTATAGKTAVYPPWPCVHFTGCPSPLPLPCSQTQQSTSMKTKNSKIMGCRHIYVNNSFNSIHYNSEIHSSNTTHLWVTK